VASIDEIFKIVSTSEMSIYFIYVFSPISYTNFRKKKGIRTIISSKIQITVISVSVVGNDGGNPNSIESHAYRS
jgi:hypothetical protein